MPGPDIAAMMAAMQQGQMPSGQGPAMPAAPQGPPSDEDMLAQVQRGMGNEGGPPPGSGMKWENLQDDQAALQANPTPENVAAFTQYWGEENLPEGLAAGQDAGPPESTEGEY
jgi:hypothetical protein